MIILIVPDYKSKKSDVIVRYEMASPDGEAFHEFLIQLSKRCKDEMTSYSSSKINLYDINQATKEWTIAFDESCFEDGNLNQHLHFIVDICERNSDLNLKILDIKWTKNLLSKFPSPIHGIPGIQQHFSINDRPLLSGLIGSKIQVSGKEIIEEAYHMWMGGCDIVAERQSIRNISLTDFEDRISYISKEMSNCMKRTGKQKEYLAHVSGSSYEEILLKIQKIEKHGLSIISLDEDNIGYAGLHSLRNQFGKRGIMILSSGLRKKNLSHFLDIKGSRLIGTDIIRIDHISARMRKSAINDANKELGNHSEKIMPYIHIDSTYKDLEHNIKELGHDFIIESDRLIKSHPDGIKEGASAVLSAISAASQGIDQDKASRDHKSLKKALEQEYQRSETMIEKESKTFVPL